MTQLRVGDFPMKCTNCTWEGHFELCVPEEGVYGCPECGAECSQAVKFPGYTRRFDATLQLKDCVVGIDRAGDDGEAVVMTKISYGPPRKVERIWELERQLTQEDLVELPKYTKVVIVWSNGSGPWEYEIWKSAGRAYAGSAAYPIGNVGTQIGQTMIWLVAK